MFLKLKQLGLTENESKVYFALLELGPVHAGLITRKSGLHRRVVYDTLDMLIKKGLIGYILENNLRLYSASNPEKLIDIIREKESEINEVMPLMLSLYNRKREEEGTNFYKGKAGLKYIFEDQLKTGKEILILGASSLAYEVLQFYFKWYDQRRKEKRIKSRIIAFSKSKFNRIPFSDVRYLPNKYANPLAVNIYGDKIAIILWNKEKPLAILIKNKNFSDSYRKYFELMWNLAKKKDL